MEINIFGMFVGFIMVFLVGAAIGYYWEKLTH